MLYDVYVLNKLSSIILQKDSPTAGVRCRNVEVDLLRARLEAGLDDGVRGAVERKIGLSRWQHLQVLIQRLATDAELARKRGFLLAGLGAAAQLDNLVVHQRFLATSVGSALFGVNRETEKIGR